MTHERIQQTIGILLRAGVLLSASVVGVGAVWYLVEEGSAPVHLARAAQPHWTGPHLLMLIGLLILMATPVARVAFSLVAFLLERDYTYVAISALVLTVLLISIISGIL